MARDDARIEGIQRALGEAKLDAIVCALPANVLLLSGYWLVVGTALSLATRDGRTMVIAPEDERELAGRAWVDEVRTFRPGSLTEIKQAASAVRGPLRNAAEDLRVKRGRIGYEAGAWFEPASYTAMHLYGAGIMGLLKNSLPSAAFAPADELLARLRAAPTPAETEHIRAACRIAEGAFLEGARQLCVGLKETEAATFFRASLSVADPAAGIARADGFVFCMSGDNSAMAYGAYARSRDRELEPGDLVLVHCNSYADGYWTDITRTFCVGGTDRRKREMYEAVFAARQMALQAIRPGAKAADVDRAAREALKARGFGEQFKHPTGHGVGFAAIDHHAPPRLHPKSEDVLEAGMVFNVEPAIYLEGYGGLRHCEMVRVTEGGAEVLTPFQNRVEQLSLTGATGPFEGNFVPKGDAG